MCLECMCVPAARDAEPIVDGQASITREPSHTNMTKTGT